MSPTRVLCSNLRLNVTTLVHTRMNAWTTLASSSTPTGPTMAATCPPPPTRPNDPTTQSNAWARLGSALETGSS